jgi:hypothetical protein
MKDLKKRLDNIKGMVVGLEMETNLLEHDLGRIEVDLFYLDKMQRDLVYNINLLKRDDIVSVISQYRKSVDALREVRKQIIKFRYLRQDLQKNIESRLKQCEYYLEQFKRECENNHKLLQFKKRER